MKLAVLNANDLIPDLSDEFKILGEDDMMAADAILMWNDVIPIHHIMCREARERGIRTFVIQHGFIAWKDYSKYIPMADYFLTWGKQDTEMAIKYGWDKSKVIRIGSPLLEHKLTKLSNGRRISFAPVEGYYPAEKDEVEHNNQQIWEVMRSITGVIPTVKLLHTHDKINYIGNKVVTNKNSPNHLKTTVELVRESSCVVCQYESTYEMLACLHDIPIVTVKNEFMAFPCSHETSMDNLKRTINFALMNPNIKKTERRQTLENYFGIPETDKPRQSIIDTIHAYA